MALDLYDYMALSRGARAAEQNAQNTAEIRAAIAQQTAQFQTFQNEMVRQRAEEEQIAKAALWLLETDRNFANLPLIQRSFFASHFVHLTTTAWQPHWFTKQPHVFDAYHRLKASSQTTFQELAEQKGIGAVAAIKVIAELQSRNLLVVVRDLTYAVLADRVNHLAALHERHKNNLGIPSCLQRSRSENESIPQFVVRMIVLAIVGALVVYFISWFCGNVTGAIGGMKEVAAKSLASSIKYILFAMLFAFILNNFRLLRKHNVKALEDQRRGVAKAQARAEALNALTPEVRTTLQKIDEELASARALIQSCCKSVGEYSGRDCRQILDRHISEAGIAKELAQSSGDTTLVFSLYLDRFCAAEGLSFADGPPIREDVHQAYRALEDTVEREVASFADSANNKSAV
jgi:hypothetical protein